MPNVPINDIRVYHKDLVVATQGRAVWILDNLSSLHQITPQVIATAVHISTSRVTAIAPAMAPRCSADRRVLPADGADGL